MKGYAEDFYKGRQWQKVSRAYMQSRNYICERCGGTGSICHHRIYITPRNIGNPAVTLGAGNLECLCQDCHNKEHKAKHSQVQFDCDGNITGVREGREIEEYREALKAIEGMRLREVRNELCGADQGQHDSTRHWGLSERDP